MDARCDEAVANTSAPFPARTVFTDGLADGDQGGLPIRVPTPPPTLRCQMLGGFNYTKTMNRGMQLGGINEADNCQGLQFGGVNLAKTCNTLQFGGINEADNCRGLQFGAINYSRTLNGGLQIGVLNFVRDGTIPFMPLINANF